MYSPSPVCGTLCYSYSDSRFMEPEHIGLSTLINGIDKNKDPSNLLIALTVQDPDAFQGAQG